jgi:uncharacterized protein (TIGR02757 family)
VARKKLSVDEMKCFLDEKVLQFNRPHFIADDPISIPHRFSKKEDIEIAAFFAAILAWGQRKTIINKCNQLMSMMGEEPHRFIIGHSSRDLKPFQHFRHRTFNGTDTLYFIEALRKLYTVHGGIEKLFAIDANHATVETGIMRFHREFFSIEDHPSRTKKHLSTPEKKSTCKRINMFLRWMVRQDKCGVDFGIWKSIKPSQLVCPCDVHVDRVGRKLKLIKRKQRDWLTAVELTENLKAFDPADPVKYDFALFGLGIEGWR